MFNIDIPSWLTPELFVQGLAIFIGIVVGAFFNFLLQRRQWAKEQNERDMGIIYEPLLNEISKSTESEKFLTSNFSPCVSFYKNIRRRGKINPKLHYELKKDMDDLVKKIDKEDEIFKTLRHKLKPLFDKNLKNISVIIRSGEKKSLINYFHPTYTTIIWGQKEEWADDLNERVKEIEAKDDVEKVDLPMSEGELFDYILSQVKNERDDWFDIKNEIFTKAKEIKKRLDYKAKHPKKRYGDQ